jgi:hypothetical protein
VSLGRVFGCSSDPTQAQQFDGCIHLQAHLQLFNRGLGGSHTTAFVFLDMHFTTLDHSPHNNNNIIIIIIIIGIYVTFDSLDHERENEG